MRRSLGRTFERNASPRWSAFSNLGSTNAPGHDRLSAHHDEAAVIGPLLVVYMPVRAVSRPDRTAAANAS